MATNLEREVRALKVYAIAATIICAALFAMLFWMQNSRHKFGEIDVERINVVESDGRLRMVISNEELQHPGISNGKVIKRDGPRPPGMVFFNQAGDEMGGLIFGENGDVGHFGQLSFDKVHNDQAIGFRYLESDNGTYSTGLEIWQQPDIPSDVLQPKYDEARKITDSAAQAAAYQALLDNGELTTRRLFMGKTRDNRTLLSMSDIKGNPRIRLSVAADGASALEFLDEDGNVTYRLPEAKN